MFKRDILDPMRFSVLLGLVASLLAPSAALADETIVATTGTRYAATEYTIDQGEPLSFRNDDLSGPSHDVQSTANGQVKGRLFASDIVEQGKTSFVEGSQYLTTGTYDFLCSIHPSMKGKLIVNAAGTPKPRPGTTPTAPGEEPRPADQTAPEPSLDFGAMRAAAIRKAKRIVLKAGADEAVAMKVTVKIGKAVVARKSLKLAARGKRTLRLALGKKALKRVRKGARIAFTVDVADTAGNLGTAKDSVKLR
jgi:plastocyanin